MVLTTIFKSETCLNIIWDWSTQEEYYFSPSIYWRAIWTEMNNVQILGAVYDVLGGDGLSGNPAVDWQDLPG